MPDVKEILEWMKYSQLRLMRYRLKRYFALCDNFSAVPKACLVHKRLRLMRYFALCDNFSTVPWVSHKAKLTVRSVPGSFSRLLCNSLCIWNQISIIATDSPLLRDSGIYTVCEPPGVSPAKCINTRPTPTITTAQYYTDASDKLQSGRVLAPPMFRGTCYSRSSHN